MGVDVEGEFADASSDVSDEDEDESEEVKMLKSKRPNCSASYPLGVHPPVHRYRVHIRKTQIQNRTIDPHRTIRMIVP